MGEHILLTGVAALFFACIDLQNAGPRIAEGFEIQTETKQDSSSVATTFNGQTHDSISWVGVKFTGTVSRVARAGGFLPLISRVNVRTSSSHRRSVSSKAIAMRVLRLEEDFEPCLKLLPSTTRSAAGFRPMPLTSLCR